VEDLSKGMSQKLQFVTTVLHKPKLIILDEPFSGLDPVNANLIKDEIYKLAREGATILFSTHRMEQVEEICDSIVLINKGQKILDGSVQQVKQDFKEHLFALQIAEPLSVPSNSLFDIIRQNGNEYVLRQHANASNNDVLNYFISNGAQVQSFHEILPSLNEIFIRLVEGTPMARQFNDRLN
jgi:ABC-2 type transport system ATP-binding protein